MRKLLVTLIFVAGVSLATNAQDVVFGVKAGINFSKFGQDADADGRTGFFFGGIADFTLSDDRFHIQPEALFSMEGSEDLEASFLRLLGIGKYEVAEGFTLQAGPQIGIRISADDDIEDATKSFDFGVAIGVGYELPDIPLFFDARFNAGLANLSDVEGFDTNLATFQLGIGYKFL